MGAARTASDVVREHATFDHRHFTVVRSRLGDLTLLP
jgi:hypothetical protein